MNRAYRWALGFGIRQALRPRRGAGLTFLSGVGVGAGLMFLLANRGEPRATPQRAARPPASRRPRAAKARAKSPAR